MTTRNERRAQQEQQERQELAAHMLGWVDWINAFQGSAERFTMNILQVMKEQKLGLDAAIVAVRGDVYRVLDAEPLVEEAGETPEVRREVSEMFERALDAAAEHMRQRVEAARQLIALAEQGSSDA